MNINTILPSAGARLGGLALLASIASACASAPPAPVKPPTISFEQKMAWMLQLEDQRILKVDLPPPAPPPVLPKGRKPAAAPPAPIAPDLAVLAADSEPRVRRRAAMAIGRVGLKEGIAPLTTALADADPEVREMAAFALGLIADPSVVPQLVAALADPSPAVRGRAAEALGLIGSKDEAGLAAAKGAAAEIGTMAAAFARTPAVTSMPPDADQWPAPAPEADAFRLGIFALVRLRAYEALAGAVLDANGHVVTRWWPVAFALQRSGDRRAQPALLELLHTPGKYSAAFAARGLGALKDPALLEALTPLASAQTPIEVAVSAVRAIGQIGDARGAAVLGSLASDPAIDPNLRLECVTAIGTLRAAEALPVVQDLLSDPWPSMRAAALRAAAAIDPENFVLVLSSMDPDRQWTVRAALADALATLDPPLVLERVRGMLQDEDKRTVPSVLGALARLKAPDLATLALNYLKEPDFAIRAAAARIVGQLKPPGAAAALQQAFTLAQGDAASDARAAILDALIAVSPADASAALQQTLADKDWALRLRAADRLLKLQPPGDFVHAIRPAPGPPIAPYDDPELIAPATSPHVFIETAKGTIEFELAVLDAPQTSRNFITLARKGFFNGIQIHRVVPNFVVQGGDPRGDGEGGPGYSIRDELNERPFVRGTVGMALSGPDTGGSQFFIMHSPAPHLDAKYTVFGHVVNGIEVVDRIQVGDVIQRIRIWDGKTMQ